LSGSAAATAGELLLTIIRKCPGVGLSRSPFGFRSNGSLYRGNTGLDSALTGPLDRRNTVKIYFNAQKRVILQVGHLLSGQTDIMKEFLTTILVALVLSCIFNSVSIWMGESPNLPPYPYGAGIKEVKTSAPHFGCKREDSCIPEIEFNGSARPSYFITDITEKGDRSNAEFPLGANN
jgi:hypothetical protein